MSAPLSLHIERLVLEGLPLDVAQSAAFGRALERALVARLQERPSVDRWQGGAVPALGGAPCAVGAGADSAAFVQRVAGSLHTALKGPR